MNIRAIVASVLGTFRPAPLPTLSPEESSELLRLLNDARETVQKAGSWPSSDVYINDALSNALYLVRSVLVDVRVIWGDLAGADGAKHAGPLRFRYERIVTLLGIAATYIETAASAKNCAMKEVYVLIGESAALVGAAQKIAAKLILV